MKKAGLAALGVVGACAACCAIPVVIPVIGALSVSGLSLLTTDALALGPIGTWAAVAVSVGAAMGLSVWYLGQRRQGLARAEAGAACTTRDSHGAGGCGCAK